MLARDAHLTARHARRGTAHAARRAGASLLVALAALASPALLGAADGDAVGVSLDTRIHGGEPRSVALADPIAYVGLDSGLDIYDIAVPAVPLLLGQLYLPSPAYDLAVVGDLVFVAAGESGLIIVDASDPSRPFVLGSLRTSGTRGVAVAGSIAYLAEASEPPALVFGLRTVDISLPSAPVALGFVALPNGALDVAVSGATAYLGLGSTLTLPFRGLAAVSIRTPASPVLIGLLETEGPVHGVALDGSVAFLATGFPLSGAFVTADVSVPSAPSLLGSARLADAGRGVDVRGGTAWVAAGGVGLRSYDVTSPAAPILRDSLPTARDASAVAARGDLALVGERSTSGLGSFTIALTPPAPARMSELGRTSYADAIDVVLADGLGYLLRTDALEIYDATDPSRMTQLGSWAPPDANLSALDVSGSLAAVSQGSTVRLVDVADVLAPAERGQVRLSDGAAVRPILDGSTLYVINGRGFETFDVSAPVSPTLLGSYDAGSWSGALGIDGGLGYLASGTGLQVIDLGAPSAPSLITTLELSDRAYAVAARDGIAVVGGHDSALHVVDISSPSSPAELGSLPGGRGFDVVLSGTHAVLAAGRQGLLVADLSDPAAPTIDASYDTSGAAAAVAVSGTSVHLATGDAQHWTVACPSCADSACLVGIRLDPAVAVVCAGTGLDLVASTTELANCAAAALVFEWFEDGALIPGATTARYSIPEEHAVGSFSFSATAHCASEPSCAGLGASSVSVDPETWPVIAANSLRLVKAAPGRRLSWAIASGSGSTNVHLTTVKAELPALHTDLLKLAGSSASTSWTDAAPLPALAIGYYRVYGRRSCSGGSEPP